MRIAIQFLQTNFIHLCKLARMVSIHQLLSYGANRETHRARRKSS